MSAATVCVHVCDMINNATACCHTIGQVFRYSLFKALLCHVNTPGSCLFGHKSALIVPSAMHGDFRHTRVAAACRQILTDDFVV